MTSVCGASWVVGLPASNVSRTSGEPSRFDSPGWSESPGWFEWNDRCGRSRRYSCRLFHRRMSQLGPRHPLDRLRPRIPRDRFHRRRHSYRFPQRLRCRCCLLRPRHRPRLRPRRQRPRFPPFPGGPRSRLRRLARSAGRAHSKPSTRRARSEGSRGPPTAPRASQVVSRRETLAKGAPLPQLPPFRVPSRRSILRRCPGPFLSSVPRLSSARLLPSVRARSRNPLRRPPPRSRSPFLRLRPP
jgi:hypothetical protein